VGAHYIDVCMMCVVGVSLPGARFLYRHLDVCHYQLIGSCQLIGNGIAKFKYEKCLLHMTKYP
jgi:hypothetical protein